jgi:N-acetylmuramic acid 6-phosphate (MurNAc-6-P) etherase
VNQSKKNKLLSRHGKKWLVQTATNFSRQKAQKAQNRSAFYVPSALFCGQTAISQSCAIMQVL